MSRAQSLRRWFVSPLSYWRRLFTRRTLKPFRHARTASRPGLEALEDRTLMSVTPTLVNPSWVPEGPVNIATTFVEGILQNSVGGAVDAIVVDPKNIHTVYVGTVNGGVWKTTDITQANPDWKPLTDQQSSLSISSLRLDPRDGTDETLFAATGLVSNAKSYLGAETGVLKTTDGGKTWVQLGLSGSRITSVVPTALLDSNTGPGRGGQIVLASVAETDAASADQGVYVSDDGGVSFRKISGANRLPAGGATDLIPDLSKQSRFYAAVPGQGIYRTDDGGTNWTPVNNGLAGTATSGSIRLAVFNDQNGGLGTSVVWAGLVDAASRGLAGLFRSTDQGDNWTALALPSSVEGAASVGLIPGGQGLTNFSIAADPKDPNLVYVGGDRQPSIPSSIGNTAFGGRIFRLSALADTPASGTHGQQLVSSAANGTAPHADTRVIAFDTDGNLLEGDDGGIYRLTTPNTPTEKWDSRNGNLDAIEVRSVAYDRVNDAVIAGTQDNGSLAQGAKSARAWSSVLGGDGNTQAVGIEGATAWRYSLANNFTTFTRRQFDATGNPIGGAQKILLKKADGTSALNATDANFRGFSTIPFAINANDPTKLLIGMTGLYEFQDRGDTLVEQVGPAAFPRQITAVAYGGLNADGSRNDNVVYAAAGDKIFVRDGAGRLFSRFRQLPAGTTVRSIALDPHNWTVAYAVDDSHVWATVNAGDSWTDITGDLAPDNTAGLRSVQVVHFTADAGANLPARDVLLVGGINGVFRTFNPVGAPNSVASPLLNLEWTQLGGNLPHAAVSDLKYIRATAINGNPAGDVLVVGTLGRGVWEVRNAGNFLRRDPVLQINGDKSASNLRLVPDSTDPATLDVLVNNQSVGQYHTASLRQIVINGDTGSMLVTVDSAIVVPDGISFTGGKGSNTLTVIGHPGGSVVRQDNTADGQVVVTGAATLTVNFKGVGTVTTTGFDAAPSAAALADGLKSAGKWSQLKNTFSSKTIPLLGSVKKALSKLLPSGNDPNDPANGAPPDADAGSVADAGSNDSADGLLQRLFDALGIDLNNFAASPLVTDLSSPAVGKRYSLTADTTLSGGNDLALSVFGGAFTLNGDLSISTKVHLHLIVGVDARGFYIEPNADPGDPEISVGDLTVSGDLNAAGGFGLLNIGLDNASLIANLTLKLKLTAPATDPISGVQDGRIRPYLFARGDLNLLSVQLVGGHASDPSVNDLQLNADLTVDLGVLTKSYPIRLTWADVGGVPVLDSTISADLANLLQTVNGKVQTGLDQLTDLADKLGASNALTTPIKLLPLKDGSDVHKALGDYLDVSSVLKGRLVNPIKAYLNTHATLDSLPTLDGLEQAILQANGLADGVSATFGPGITISADGGKLSIHFPFQAQHSEDLSLDLSSLNFLDGVDLPLGLSAKVHATTNVTLQMSVNFDLLIGLDLSQLLDPKTADDTFTLTFATPPSISAKIVSPGPGAAFDMELDLTPPNNLPVKLLDIGGQINGTIAEADGTKALLDASVKLKFSSSPMHLSELKAALADPGSLIVPSANVGLSIPVSLDLGGINVGDVISALPVLTVSGDVFKGGVVVTTDTKFISSLKKMVTLSTLFSLIRDPSQLAVGLDSALGVLQGQLNAAAGLSKLPLVGSNLNDTAQFIDKFRGGLLAKIEADTKNVGNNALTAVQQSLFHLVGPDNLNLLVGATATTAVPITYPDDNSVQFNLHLHQTFNEQVGFDPGLDGLPISLAGKMQANFGWDFYFGFGLSLTDGVYLDTAAKDSSGKLTPELAVTLDVKAPPPGFSATGSLGVLDVTATDSGSELKGNLDGNNTIVSVDLKDKNGNDGRLKITDIPNLTLSNIFQVKYGFKANINLNLVTSVDTSGVSAALSALGVSTLSDLGKGSLPSLAADLAAAWNYHSTDSTHAAPTAEFDNVQLDVGSLLSQVVMPVVTNIQKVTGPLADVIKFLQMEVPVLSDLAKKNGGEGVTFEKLLADAAAASNGKFQDPTVFIDAVAAINGIHVPDLGTGSFLINLGKFKLTDPSKAGAGVNMDKSTSSTNSKALDDADSQIVNKTGTKGFLSGLEGLLGGDGFITLSALHDPMGLFQLLAGSPAGNNKDLIKIHLPTLTNVGFAFDQVFPLVTGVVSVKLGGGFSLKSDLTFGYDTSGLYEYQHDTQRNPLDLIDGFYVATTNAAGKPVPQFTFHGNLHADLELGPDLQGVSLTTGVEGGVDAFVYFRLHDPNNDGKVHVNELIQDVKTGFANLGDPLKALSYVFDIKGDVSAYLQLFVRADHLNIPGLPFTYDLARVQLFSFDTGSANIPKDTSAFDPPTADFTANQTVVREGAANVTVQFDNAQSNNPNAKLVYSYDYNNDGVFDDENIADTQPRPVAEHFFDDGPAKRTVHGRVTDTNSGMSTDYFVTIQVNNVAPTATFAAATNPDGTRIVGFTNASALLTPIDLSSTGAHPISHFPDTPTDGAYVGPTGDNVSIVATSLAVPVQNGISVLNTSGGAVENGPWVGAGQVGSDKLSIRTFFDIPDAADPASTKIHLDYTFWVEDIYNADNLIWQGGHEAYVLLNGQQVNITSTPKRYGNVAVSFFGQWYQVLELGASFDVPASAVQSGINTLTFVFQMGSASFSPGWTSPVRDAGRALLNVKASGAVLAVGGYDPSGIDVAAGFRYSYDFNNTGNFDITDSNTATATIPFNLLNDGKPHVIHGRIADKDGGYTDYYTSVAGVQQNLPIGGPYVISEGDDLHLVAVVSTANGNPAPTVEWDLNGDGNFSDATGADVTLSWDQLKALGVNDGPKTYAIAARARRSDGTFVASATTQLFVRDTPPNVSISGPATVTQGSAYQLTLENFGDPGNDAVTSWNIAWGDGQTSTILIDPATGRVRDKHARIDAAGHLVTIPIQVPLRQQFAPPGASIFTRPFATVQEPFFDQDGNLSLNSAGEVQYQAVSEDSLTRAGYLFLTADGLSIVYTIVAAPVYDIADIGPASSAIAVMHSYATSGQSYVVTATAYDDDGASDAGKVDVKTVNVAPSGLKLTVTPATIDEGQSVTLSGSFTDHGVQDISTVTIDWGDGSLKDQVFLAAGATSFGGDPTAPVRHTYLNSTAGYTLRVTVTDANGGSTEKDGGVTVTNVAPAVRLTGSGSAFLEGTPITLGSIVTDVSPDATTFGFKYSWSVTKNGVHYGDDGHGANYTFTPDDNADYAVTLTVTDKDNGKTTVSKTLSVKPVAPTVTVLAPASSSPEGTPLLFSSTVTDPSAVDTTDGFMFHWSVTKDGVNYSLPAGTAVGASSFTFTPTDNGAYVVKLEADDGDGQKGFASSTLTVTNANPAVTVLGVPDSSPEGTPIGLTAVGTDPGAADQASLTYSWTIYHVVTLPVGSIILIQPVIDATGIGPNFTFTPADNNTYSGLLTVKDKDGGQFTTFFGLNITNVAPVVTLTGNPGISPEGTTITLAGIVSDLGAVDTAAGFTYAWTVTKNGSVYATGADANPTFTPDDNGVYAVTLSATDKDGGTGTDATVVLVTNVAPNATFTAPASGVAGTPINLSAAATDVSSVDTAAGFNFAWLVTKDDVTVVTGTSPTLSFTPRDAGTYKVSMSASDKDGGTAVGSVLISVLSATGGYTVGATENLDSGLQTVATFIDPVGDPNAPDGAIIRWGDGTIRDTIALAAGASSVQGRHLYAEEGNYAVGVTLTHGGAAIVSTSSNATVGDPSVSAMGGFTVTTTEGSDSGLQTVATFNDPGGAESLSDYGATISWGDGSSSVGIVALSNGVFTVQGHHQYAEDGKYPVGVRITHDATSAVSVNSTATVSDPTVSATGGFTIIAVEGSDFGLQTVATFTDPGGPETLSDYAASISWGDGSSSAGTITVSDGVFAVQGQHKYAEDGNFTIGVTLTHESTAPVSVSSTAKVSDPSVTGTGAFTLTATEGSDSSLQALATFTDPGGVESLADYAATITWGDGTSSAAGIAVNNALFTVLGHHQYAEDGNYTVGVTLTHESTPAVSVNSTAKVSDAGVIGTGGFTVTATEGNDSGLQTVATFTDPGGAESVGDYAATIAWGDGSSAGTITLSNGVFTVQGRHTYAEDGTYTIGVTLTHESTTPVSVSSTAKVSDPGVIGTGGFPVSAAEGSDSVLQTVATFTDPGGAEVVGDYSATIGWGDGSSSAGTITVNSGVFTVQGQHKYTEEGTYTISVMPAHEKAPRTSVISSAKVADGSLSAVSVAVKAIAGAPFSGKVAAFTDADPTGVVSDFKAVITWGDGNASAGVIASDGKGGYTVSGSNTFAAPTKYAFTVVITDVGGAPVTTAGLATVNSLGEDVDGEETTDIGFWHARRGQALINSFNGSSTATALGDWLASNFSNIYGANAGGNNLAGKTNAQVAAFYQTLFDLKGTKLDAEVLATALNVYDTTLALGGKAGECYGFDATAWGLGALTVSVGNSGAAFGVANNTSLNVYQILKGVDKQAKKGVLYNGDATLISQAEKVFDAINKGEDD